MTREDDIVVSAAAVVGAADLAAALEALPEAIRVRALRAERVTQLAMAAAGIALEQAGVASGGDGLRADVGVVLGTGFGCFLTNAEHQRRLATAGPAGASPRTFAATVSNAATGEIGIAWRLAGPAVTLAAGLASGLAAVGEGAALVRRGAASAVLAGGADAWGAALARWLADAGLASHVVPGEGAAWVVLERREVAAARGRAPLASIASWATAFAAGRDATPPALESVALNEAAVVVAADAVAVATTEGVAGPVRRPLPPGLGERGLAGLLAAAGDVPTGAVVVAADRCFSGHVAAVALRREERR